MPSKSILLAFPCKQVDRHQLRCSYMQWKCLKLAEINASVSYFMLVFSQVPPMFWALVQFPMQFLYHHQVQEDTTLEDRVSPALTTATAVVIVTVVISVSAYLCFLRYICSGCCQAAQVGPDRRLDHSRTSLISPHQRWPEVSCDQKYLHEVPEHRGDMLFRD